MSNRKQSRLLNNLSMEEKLRVIKAYSEQPSYQQLANAFKCSSKQIRNILFDRNNLSVEDSSVQTHDNAEGNQDLHQTNLKNIALIDKVVKEWFYRAKNYPTTGKITYKMIREKVQEAREVLNITNFIPTNSWMYIFRNDCNKIVANRKVHETKLLSLNIRSIAKHVLQQQDVTKEQMNLVYGIYDRDDDKELITPPSTPKITVLNPDPNDTKIDSVESFVDDKLVNILAVRVDPNKNEISKECEDDNLRKDCQPMIVLKNSDDALRYLKPLEDFALLTENYRAIGLLTQLEAHFCKKVS